MAQLETGATRRWKDLFAVYFIALGGAFTLAWFALVKAIWSLG